MHVTSSCHFCDQYNQFSKKTAYFVYFIRKSKYLLCYVIKANNIKILHVPWRILYLAA